MEAQAQKFYLQAQKETSVLLSAYDQAQAEELRGVTFGDRLNSLLEATIKKLDETFDSQQITEDKKQRLSDVKKRLDKARKIEDDKQKLLEEVQNKIAELQGQVKKETRSAIETTSSMPLFGATTLMQVESFDDLRGQYNIASLVVWSPKLELEARGMLLGAGKGKPRKNKISIDEWLDKQNLSSMVGARRYLASDGSTNFMGISAVEYDPDDSGSYSMLEEEAILWAKQAAILSLKASVESVKSAERLKRDIRGADGKVESKILKDFSANIQESVKNLTIRGLETLRIEETVHEPTGKNIIVAVANVNSALAVKASDIMKDMYATLKEVNADQSFIQGEEAGMKAEADKTLNNKAIFDAGVASGSNQVATEYDSRADDRASIGRAESQQSKESIPEDNSGSSGESQSGSWAGDIEVDDDF
jgi:membrane-associated HD superfamily phosphohydrolase